MAKTLVDFKAEHDPTHNVGAVHQVFSPGISKGTTKFIITSAQNATPVDDRWWAVLENMAKTKGAQLLVIPLRYKNPTSVWRGSQENAEHWASEVRPYLCNTRVALNKNLLLLGDIKTQPTATQPLSGFDAMSTDSSGILGHTKLQLKSIPRQAELRAKILTTTGACTQPNYTDSKAGKLGAFHHSLSAVMVEIKGGAFYLRQLHFDAKTNSCTDLATRYFADHTEQAPRALALVMGDTHVDSLDPKVVTATFAPGGMVDLLRPERLVWHDLLDGYSVNPHHVGNPFNKIGKMVGHADDVRAEVNRAISFVRDHTPEDCESIVVTSNHDDFLSRWINFSDGKNDPKNSEFYLETALAMRRGTRFTERGTEYPAAFQYWLEQADLPRCRALGWDDSLLLAGVELGMHGNLGPNGARGSITNLRRVGTKSIIGHSHSPGIDEGCVQVGTSTFLRLEYNHGASSWLNAHCVLNADGKRQLLIIVDGQFRAACN